MDPATFVVTTLAGALLKEVAADGYSSVKAVLVNRFGLGKAVEVLEEAPGDEDARNFAVKRLAKSPAIEDAEVLDGAALVAAELERLPEDTSLGASLTVRDLKAKSIEFRNNRVRAGGSILAERIEAAGKIVFEGNEAGDDRKR